MKKLTFFLVAIATSALFSINAQTLLYSNDFESGLNGSTIVGNGVIEASGNAAHGQVFHNAAGGQATRSNYLTLPATLFADLKTSGTNALTISFWVNKGTADNYFWSPIFSAYAAAAPGGNGVPMMVLQTRGAVQTNLDGTWCDFTDAQNVKGMNTASTAWVDDSNWHFYSVTFSTSSVNVYIDGKIINEWTLNGSAGGSSVAGLFSIGAGLPYICLGGNQAWGWNDPDPAFLYDKLKIYSGALTSAQIISLMNTDGLDAPVLTTNKSALYLDDKYTSESVIVNGINLADDITISAPVGISLGQTTISKSAATDVSVSVSWDATTIVSGNITFTSGANIVSIPVKTSINSCYTPAYATGNMIADPTFSAATLTSGGYVGWGPTEIVNKNAYCGRGTAYIRGSCWPNGGSIERALNTANGTALKPMTKYRLRAKINSKASPATYFHFQIEGVNGGDNIYFNLPNTNGWKQIDTTFTTGATVIERGIYFNSCTAATPAITDTCFIDNWEMYEVALSTSVNSTNSLINQHIYIDGNKFVVDMRLSKASMVQFLVYNAQGTCITQTAVKLENEGTITKAITAPQSRGVYFVKTIVDGKFNVTKIIK